MLAHHRITSATAGELRFLGRVALLLAAGFSSFVPGTSSAEQRQFTPEWQPVITLTDDRLTVRVEDVRLEKLLEGISRLGKVAILTEDGVGRERVSIQLDGLPLDEALRRILQGHDAFFFYAVEREGPASLRVVWVYPRGRGQGLVPIPPEAWASTREIEEESLDSDPETRARAVEALVERKGEKARGLVLRALRDPDGQVRSRALYVALRSGLGPPAELLIRLALEDPSAHVRFLALEALETDPSVIGPIAARSLTDPDPHVRNKAQEILSEADRAARRARARQADQFGHRGD